MTRYAPNTEMRFDCEVRNLAGALVDPSSITFVWRITRMGQEHTETVVKDNVGLYHALATPNEGGPFHGEFRCTNPALVVKIDRTIEPSYFASTYDPYWA